MMKEVMMAAKAYRDLFDWIMNLPVRYFGFEREL
jgi:hypothetical protein